ncbi:MAG: hypothetical protein ACYC35_06000 [Pirellulales bacterium]
MSNSFGQALLDRLPEEDASLENDLRLQVHGLLATLHQPGLTLERRVDLHYPYPRLVHLTPIDDDGVLHADEAIMVAGKHISERGLDFFHPFPLPFRRVVASLDAGNGRWLGFLLDVSWCRFTGRGWYESGGRFLQAMPSPLNEPYAAAR